MENKELRFKKNKINAAVKTLSDKGFRFLMMDWESIEICGFPMIKKYNGGQVQVVWIKPQSLRFGTSV